MQFSEAKSYDLKDNELVKIIDKVIERSDRPVLIVQTGGKFGFVATDYLGVVIPKFGNC